MSKPDQYAIKIRSNDADLLKLLDPTGTAMLGAMAPKKGSWLIITPSDPSKNVVADNREYDTFYAGRVSTVDVPLVKLNKRK